MMNMMNLFIRVPSTLNALSNESSSKRVLASNRLHHPGGDDDDEALARISVSRPSSLPLYGAVRCAGGRASSPEIALGGAGAAAEGREGGREGVREN